MLEDFKLFELEEELTLVAGAGAIGGFAGRIRGFANRSLIDGVNAAIMAPIPAIFRRQLEVVKGPQSANYGDSAPGGIVNRITKRPTLSPSTQIEVSAATNSDYQSYRAAASVSNAIIPKKLHYLAYFDDSFSGSAIDYISNLSQYYGVSLLYMPTPSTSITLTPSLFKQEARGYQFTNYYNYFAYSNNSMYIHNWRGVGDSTSFSSDQARYFRTDLSLTALLEHRFSRGSQLRLFFSYLDRKTYSHGWSGGYNYYANLDDPSTAGDSEVLKNPITGDPAPPYTSRRYPRYQNFTREGFASKGDFSLRFNSNIPIVIRHKLQLGYDFVWRSDNTNSWRMPDRIADAIYNPNNWDPASPLYHHLNASYDLSLCTQYYELSCRRETDFGALATLLSETKNKLFQSFLTARYQTLDASYGYHQLYASLPTPSQPNPYHPNRFGAYSDDQITYTIGGTWRLSGEKLVAYISIGTGYDITSVTFDRGRNTLTPPPQSEGWEVGIKGENLFKDRLNYTLCYFNTFERSSLHNDDWNGADAGNGIPEYWDGALTKSHGIELSLFATLHPSLTLYLGAGWVSSEIVAATNSYAIGEPSAGTPKYNISSVLRWKPPFLRNLTLGVNTAYQDTVISSHLAVNYLAPVTLSDIFLVNAFASYSFRHKSLRHTLALNFNNLLNRDYYHYNGRHQPGLSATLSYRINK
jgi:outer membrane receptor protein involved in Fe transport